MSLWRHPERRQLQPLRFNSLGKSEENLCRFVAADAVGEAPFRLLSDWSGWPKKTSISAFISSLMVVLIAERISDEIASRAALRFFLKASSVGGNLTETDFKLKN